ncbi:MAG: ABC transporter permease, partial [Actinomycetota bacterium]
INPPQVSRRRVPQIVWQVAVFAAVLLAWQLGAGAVDKQTFPSVDETFEALRGLLGDRGFWTAVRFTAQGWAVGLSLAMVFGISLGLAIGRSKFLSDSSKGLLDFLRSIPGVAMIFIFLGLFQSSLRMKYGIVAQAAGWPIMIQSMYGARAMSATLHDFSAAYRLSPRDRLFKLALPSAMPFIITGIRLAASVALVVNIAAEYWGSAPGLGREVIIARNDDLYPEVYALIVVAGVLGVLLNRLVVWFDRWALAWHPSNRKDEG